MSRHPPKTSLSEATRRVMIDERNAGCNRDVMGVLVKTKNDTDWRLGLR
jgi:hypothetical protein